MPLISKPNYNQIFASQAPSQDVPAEFSNYERGWDESRKNNGKPTVKQSNKLQQLTDEKILWMHQNGAALPFDETMEYAEGAVAVKDGELQQWKGGEWIDISSQEVKKYLLAAGVDESELDGDYDFLMQRLAQIAIDKGWDASFVVDGDKNQKQINDNLLGQDGSNYIQYSYLKEYAEATIGQKLQSATEKTVYLLDYIPKSQRAAILNGVSVYDASANIASAVNEAIARDATLILPHGKLTYSSFPNIKTPNFKIIGAGSNKTTLNYTGTENAFSVDAFASGSPTDPFIDGMFVSGFAVTGSTFTNGFFGQGFARSFINDIRINGSTGVDGTASFRLAGCMLSTFNNLVTSYVYGALPYRGLQLTAGSRASVSVGACSNNVFIGCYAEGNSIGWQLASNGSDQNTFIGGSPEACKVYGLLVGTNCRYNTFIGVGFENSAASVTADISDGGIYSRYTGCYSAKNVRIGSNSRGIRIESGYFERIEIQANARAAIIDQVTVNNWNTGSGGLVDLGFDTAANRVTDAQTGEFIYVRKARFSVTVGASPFLWENTHQVPVKVRVQGGTVTNTQIRRGADSWTEPNPTAAGGGAGNVGIYLLMPGDKLETSYSAAPAMSVAVMPM